MGQLGSAYCKCGYGQRITLGGGRSNHLTFAGYPYLCRSCSAVFTGNLFDETNSCQHCESTDTSSYEDATFWRPKGSSDRTQAFDWSMYIGPAPPLEPPAEPPAEPLPKPPKGLFQKLWRKPSPKPERLSIRHVSGEPIRPSISRKIVLHRGGYLCPICGDFSLSFESFGYFD
jgi:RNA polymerase subunit RPABC4/transcription elongation factor Spt4